jgi:hypothetical protein
MDSTSFLTQEGCLLIFNQDTTWILHEPEAFICKIQVPNYSEIMSKTICLNPIAGLRGMGMLIPNNINALSDA